MATLREECEAMVKGWLFWIMNDKIGFDYIKHGFTFKIDGDAAGTAEIDGYIERNTNLLLSTISSPEHHKAWSDMSDKDPEVAYKASVVFSSLTLEMPSFVKPMPQYSIEYEKDNSRFTNQLKQLTVKAIEEAEATKSANNVKSAKVR